MDQEPLCLDPGLWRVGWVTLQRDRVMLHLVPVRQAVPCPECGVESGRVHSRYSRTASDLSWCAWPVKLVIHSRKFFCDNVECSRRIFAERFPGALEPFARQTERLKSRLLELVHSSNGEMASRMAKLMGFPTSGDTLIRRQRQESFDLSVPEVLGVDEFALRRGATYSTILVDLERHRPVEVLEDRTAKPLADWLSSRPVVKIMARDRAEAYAHAGKTGAPDALQVADRFHLVKNASDALKDLVRSHRWKMPVPPDSTSSPPQPAPGRPRCEPHPTLRKQVGWEAVQRCKGVGISLRAIAREVGMSRRTVRRYLNMDAPPVYPPRQPSRTKLTPHMSYLQERWAQGCHNSRQLYRELLQRGYSGGDTQVRSLVRPWRQAGPSPPRRPCSPLWLMVRPPHHLDVSEKKELELLLEINPMLAQAYEMKEGFRHLVAQRDVAALEKWIETASGSGMSPFRAMAKTLRRDYAAVKAALTTPWSTAQVEGQNTRVKLIKRLGYGRAKLDLLRVRILHRMAVA